MKPSLLLLIAFSAAAAAMVSPIQIQQNVANTHRRYGYAFYGFWGGVILFGALYSLFKGRQARHSVRMTADVEDGPGSVPASKPGVDGWYRRVIATPAIIGHYHLRKFLGMTIPNRPEMLPIIGYWILAIVLVGVGYEYGPAEASAGTGDGMSSGIDPAMIAEMMPGGVPNNALVRIIMSMIKITPQSIGKQTWMIFSDRCATLAISQLPILWFFSSRNNIFIWVTGWSFRTFNIFHRHVARVSILLVVGHAAGKTHIGLTNTLPTGQIMYPVLMRTDWLQWGVAAGVAMGTMWIVSFSFLRKHFYEAFLVLHIGLAIIIVIGIWRHTRVNLDAYNTYIWVIVAAWGFERLMRMMRIMSCNMNMKMGGNFCKCSSTTATYNSEANVVKVEIKTSGPAIKMFSPGQYCYLYQPFALKFWESHPFSIASTEATDGGQLLTFYIRPYDGWTRRLQKQCQETSSGSMNVRLFVEGPYGQTKPFHAFDTVLCYIGGTGITSTIPYIKDHLKRSAEHTTRVTSFQLIWSTREVSFAHYVIEQELRTAIGRPDFNVKIHLTSPRSIETEKIDGIDVSDGRPDIEKFIMLHASQLDAGQKCAVFACGPADLVDTARAGAYAAMKAGHRNIEYFEESYSW